MLGIEIILCLMSLVSRMDGVNSVEHISNLTTAVPRRSTSPKPTTVYRRISVDKTLESISSSQINFSQLLETRRKKEYKHSDIWKWDYWCQLQPKTGSCERTLNRFYYNSHLDKCLPFVFSGCDGNKNNFVTPDECNRCCEGAGYTHIEDSTDSSFCYLQPNTGFCLALITRYYFDIKVKSCKEFIYGGCGGNQNRFKTIHSCMRICSA